MALFTARGHGLGSKASPPNPKELGFPSHLVVRAGDFPVRAFITGALGPTKDQGSQGSCTAHGATSEGERLYRRYKGTSPIFAPAFHYYIEREIEGTLGQDNGAQVDTSLVVAENPGLPTSVAGGGKGFCPESEMPYNQSDFSTPPSPTALAAALLNPGGSHHSIGNIIANIKSCILSDYSGVIGISVYSSFDTPESEASGLIPLPNLEVEALEGGHEMHSLIGFDDEIQCPNAKPGAVLTQNSWGPGWGIAPPEPTLSTQRGFCWIPYSYLMNVNLTSDIRMQHCGKPW